MVSVVSGSTAALQGQIKRDQLDLNDWVTCVSAKTPKGKAEIQKISGEISVRQQPRPIPVRLNRGTTADSSTSGRRQPPVFRAPIPAARKSSA
jgi:hypothetical protein